MADGAPVLEIEDLIVEATVRTPGAPARVVRIVDGVSARVERGRVLGLIGESGAGKSTIGLAALGHGRGGCRIVGGKVTLEGVDALANARALRGRSVTYVAQSAAAAFNPAYRIGDQVVEAVRRHGALRRDVAEKRAVALFAALGLPEPERFGRRYPHQVSGGQLQRAMTAMALCPNPALIVFDEPTTALDVTTQIEVLAAIKRAIREIGVAALYISHDLAVVAQIADDILVLRHGRMVEAGPTRAILEAPAQDYTRALVSIRPLLKTPDPRPTAPLLAIEHVDAAYGRTQVLFDVSLTVDKGRTLAVVGESGSGKSTLARVVTGLLPPSAGRVLEGGRPLAPALDDRPREDLRKVQLVHQMADVALNPRQTIAEIVGRPLRYFHGLGAVDARRRVEALLERMELPKSAADRYPAELSGGQKQRVAIARALAAEPEILLCDEPTSALDPLVADGVLALLADLQRESGVTILFITHDIAIVRAIADSVAVMHQGRVVRFGPKSEALSPPFDAYTELLLKSAPEMRVGWLEQALAERRMAAAGN